MASRKFYVVWEGRATGIFDSWEECKAQIDGYPGAKYKSFGSQTEATLAFRGAPEEHIGILKAIATHSSKDVDYTLFPEIILDAIAVDAACAKNPGPMEYQGVMVGIGAPIFHVGPLAGGTNNVGEFLAIVHALAMLDKKGDNKTAIYSDSKTAMAWVRDKKCKTTLQPTSENKKIFELVKRAEAWLNTHTWTRPIIKWKTEEWGEIPADFGRKR